MTFSDEILMAYADGEVDDELRAQIDAAMAVDPKIAAIVERHRKLRAQLSDAFSGSLDEPVPERLFATLAVPAGTESNVIELADKRASKQTARWRLREWGALAATFVIGVSLGLALMSRDNAMVSSEHGALVANGALATALSEQLASTQRGDEAVTMGISFKAYSGTLCRTFTIRANQLAGIACRDNATWRVQMLTDNAASGAAGDYRQAASAMPAPILTQVEQRMVGEPFDADAEINARRGGWKH